MNRINVQRTKQLTNYLEWLVRTCEYRTIGSSVSLCVEMGSITEIKRIEQIVTHDHKKTPTKTVAYDSISMEQT